MPLIWPLCKMWAHVGTLGSGQLTAAKVHGRDELAAEGLHGGVGARIFTLLHPLIAFQQWWQLRARLQNKVSSTPQAWQATASSGHICSTNPTTCQGH